jgi:hypothetical protein
MVCKKYTPIIGFFMHFQALSMDWEEKCSIRFNYCNDSSVFNASLLTKEDFKRILTHNSNNAKQFSNQGYFNDQGGYLKGYMYKSHELLKEHGLDPKECLSDGISYNDEREIANAVGISEDEYDDLPYPYNSGEVGMMYAWKSEKPDYGKLRDLRHTYNLRVSVFDTLEECIDNFLEYVGCSTADFKL